ncbi:hypothetical protein BDN72DRAFT_848766 [Pluteus cervinus]|uniref:Uncharacterized protein n=1 Tax=Pluteus cervinus TaxID=181527 RepID=A0ACD3A9Z7_9AGAR|nr:hypothetical protein BDN72DRAFT_848766 [Pluteus cervinus]
MDSETETVRPTSPRPSSSPPLSTPSTTRNGSGEAKTRTRTKRKPQLVTMPSFSSVISGDGHSPPPEVGFGSVPGAVAATAESLIIVNGADTTDDEERVEGNVMERDAEDQGEEHSQAKAVESTSVSAKSDSTSQANSSAGIASGSTTPPPPPTLHGDVQSSLPILPQPSSSSPTSQHSRTQSQTSELAPTITISDGEPAPSSVPLSADADAAASASGSGGESTTIPTTKPTRKSKRGSRKSPPPSGAGVGLPSPLSQPPQQSAEPGPSKAGGKEKDKAGGGESDAKEDDGTRGVVLHINGLEYNRRLIMTPQRVRFHERPAGNWAFTKCLGGDSDFLAAGQLLVYPNCSKSLSNVKDYTYVFYIIEGTVTVKIHSGTYNLSTGGMFIVPPGNIYSVENTSSKEAKLFFAQARKVDPPVVIPTTDQQDPTSMTFHRLFSVPTTRAGLLLALFVQHLVKISEGPLTHLSLLSQSLSSSIFQTLTTLVHHIKSHNLHESSQAIHGVTRRYQQMLIYWYMMHLAGYVGKVKEMTDGKKMYLICFLLGVLVRRVPYRIRVVDMRSSTSR